MSVVYEVIFFSPLPPDSRYTGTCYCFSFVLNLIRYIAIVANTMENEEKYALEENGIETKVKPF